MSLLQSVNHFQIFRKGFYCQGYYGPHNRSSRKELGVDIEKDFHPKYTTSKGKRRILKDLKDEALKVEDVFLAPDPDREGEAIAWHVAESIKSENTSVKRVMFNEITKRAVLAAMDQPKDIDMNKVNAQQARRILDRIVGYQVSPILWRTVFRDLVR